MNRLIRLVLEYLRSRQSRRKLRIIGELLREVGPDLNRYIRSRYRGENSDDIFQETLWAIADGLDNFEGKTDKAFMNWCLGIARHKVADELRARRRDRTVSLNDDEVWRAVEELGAEEPISVQDRLDLEYAMRLVAAVKAPCLDFLLSRYIQGLDYETIGSEHGISEGAAWLAVDRCVKLARKLLGE